MVDLKNIIICVPIRGVLSISVIGNRVKKNVYMDWIAINKYFETNGDTTTQVQMPSFHPSKIIFALNSQSEAI